MKIDILRRYVGLGVAALCVWLSCLPVGTLTPQDEIQNAPVEQYYRVQAVDPIEVGPMPTTAHESVDEPVTEPVIARSVQTSNTFVITAYCGENYPHICNDGDATVTATGTTPTVGRTIAVDPTVIPYGAEVIIDGHIYIAEDCGGAIKGNRIDLFFATHEEALAWGRQTKEVIIKN